MAGSLRDHLTQIYDASGILTPDLVVQVARSENHPLHDRFEWDDKVAGPAYRKVQAAELIRSVRVVYAEDADGTPREVRAFSVKRGDDVPPSCYAPTAEVMGNEFTRSLLLRECQREVVSLQRKYGHLKEFAGIVSEAALKKAS